MLDVVAGQSYIVGVAGGGSIARYAVEMQLAPAAGGGSGGSGGGSSTSGGSGSVSPGPITIQGHTATIVGTSGADEFVWNASSPQQITIGGVRYELAGVTVIQISGGAGRDTLTLVGSSAAEQVRLRAGSAEFSGGGSSLSAAGVETTRFWGGASDQAWLFDSAADDHLEASPAQARLTGGGFERFAAGCGAVNASATGGGRDTALLRDSAGADRLDANPANAWLRGTGFSIWTGGFEETTILATAGSGDFAGLYGSAGNDYLSLWGSSRYLAAGGVQIRTDGFQWAWFDGGGGYDQVDFYPTSREPRLRGRDDRGSINDGALATEFAAVESLLASVRKNHKLRTDLKAIDFVFRKIGRA
jgi:hypothetical protein